MAVYKILSGFGRLSSAITSEATVLSCEIGNRHSFIEKGAGEISDAAEAARASEDPFLLLDLAGGVEAPRAIPPFPFGCKANSAWTSPNQPLREQRPFLPSLFL